MTKHNFDAQATTPKPALVCACCGQPLASYWQPALIPTKQGYWLVECRTDDCNLHMYTLSSHNYHAAILDYGKVNA